MCHKKLYLKASSVLCVAFFALLFLSCNRIDPKNESQAASAGDSSNPVATNTSSSRQLDARSDNKSSSINESRQTAITKAVKEVSPAVVNITVTEVIQGKKPVVRGFGFFRHYGFVPYKRDIESIGSGFIIDEDGLVVTNAHVADKNAKKIIVTLANGKQYEAQLMGADKLSDIALLKIKADHKLPYIQFGNSYNIMEGEWSIAIGNPRSE